jgi:regulator-associated protein of mTOR
MEVEDDLVRYLFDPRHADAFLWAEKALRRTQTEVIPWRMKQRMKTVSVALVVCLNIGTDPPDVVKTSPCARLECWVDPFSMSAHKALETVGNALQKQYERLHPRARYRQSLDPTVEDTKKLSIAMRRSANTERVLFHYCGHGVPRPTPNGEIWVFNKDYTQYMPLSVYDLQTWVGGPAIYVFDCSAAGILVQHFLQSLDEDIAGVPAADIDSTGGASSTSTQPKVPPILLAACSPNELLPMNPGEETKFEPN